VGLKDMTISIFEDNEKLRDLIVMLLGSSDEFVVQGSYPNAENIISKVMKDKPDVIVMDIDMPQYDVMEGVKAVNFLI
jgi:DNA-binding NarL/FixJ family response regulator